tara:strand:- start:435 stop:902 length:468 start_codon:yes stop_codon:yes gene_type:complete
MSKKTINRVLEKLGKTTQLSAKRHELSAIDDLRRDQDAFERVIESLDAANNLEDRIEDFQNDMQAAKDSAARLATTYAMVDEAFQEIEKYYTQTENALRNYAELAEELGVIPNDSDDYVRASTNFALAEELIYYAAGELDSAGSVVGEAQNLMQY